MRKLVILNAEGNILTALRRKDHVILRHYIGFEDGSKEKILSINDLKMYFEDKFVIRDYEGKTMVFSQYSEGMKCSNELINIFLL